MNTTDHLTTTVLESARTRSMLRRTEARHAVAISAGVALPRRIDVHRIDELVDELNAAARRSRLVQVDGAAVEMIDGAGLAALERFSGEAGLVVRDASVALAKTAQYTGHDRLHAACAPPATFEAAA